MKKLNKKGATKTLAAIAGGYVGAMIQNKLPQSVPGPLKTFGPAIISLGYDMFLAKKANPLVEGLMGGMAGATGARIATNGGLSGVLGADEEKQVLLDAFTSVNAADDEATMTRLISAAEDMGAAADFSANVAAAADFNASVAGAGDYSF